MKTTTACIRLNEEPRQAATKAARQAGRTAAKSPREILRRQLRISQFESLRRMMPLAETGVFTDRQCFATFHEGSCRLEHNVATK
jgi:hypothetical protein